MSKTARKARKPLTAVAYDAIKNEILSGRLHPGDPIPQDRLLKKLNLSRTPLREALLRLEREGFIEIHPRMGTFVAQLDLLEIRDMYEVRKELEGLAARHAAGNIASGRLDELEKRLHGLDTGPGADLAAISDAGHALHGLIIEHCDNRVLARMITSLHEHFRRFRILSLSIREKVLASHEEHLRILAALKAADPAESEALIHTHFDHAANTLLQTLITRQKGSAPAA